jgi:Sulfotransferase family
MRKTPVFIVGYPRSGTTLLMAMLGSHPEITMFNEPMLIRDMREWGLGFKGCVEGRGKVELLQKLCKRNHVSARYNELSTSFAGNIRKALAYP